MTRKASDMLLGVCGSALAQRDGKWYTHHAFGRIVELIAPRVRHIDYRGPALIGDRAQTCDYELSAPNITVNPLGDWQNTKQALRQPLSQIRHYLDISRKCDALFMRTALPFIWVAHLAASARQQRVVHWFGSNPAAVVGAERRGYGWLVEKLGVCYAHTDRLLTRLGMAAARSYALTNGAEIARLYRSKRTQEVVSTSITQNDILPRDDACTGPEIRILFVGFIRPEKGIGYLLRALPLIKSDRPIQLALVGSWGQFPAEYERLRSIITELGLDDRVSWEGYAPFGRELFDQMDRSDILAAPSLSEGTPRVLVEARARGVPVVSTLVGGIPSSVTDGQDGLLVPPRDPTALAHAISRVINEPEFRRQLIHRGRERVSNLTIERFADLVMDLLTLPRDELIGGKKYAATVGDTAGRVS